MSVNFSSDTLSMRLMSHGELTLFSTLYRSPKTMRKICQPFSEQQVMDTFTRAVNNTANPDKAYWMWVIEHNGSPIGLQSLALRQPHTNFADIGLMLLQQANGKSHAINATIALMSVGFKRLGFSRIYADFDSSNLATKRIIQKLNFIIEPNVISDELTTEAQKNITCYFKAENWQFPLPKTNNTC